MRDLLIENVGCPEIAVTVVAHESTVALRINRDAALTLLRTLEGFLDPERWDSDNVYLSSGEGVVSGPALHISLGDAVAED